MATIDDFKAEWLSDSDFVVAHTSGSTGSPKEIHLLKADMRASARATNAFFGIDSRSLLVCPLSVDYIAGKMMLVRAMEAGCRFVQTEVSNRFSLPEGTDVIDLLPVVPSQLPWLIAHPGWAGRIRNLLIGGAAPSKEVCKDLVSAGFNAYISYGMTETCSHVALARADDEGRLFKAMPGISFETDADERLAIVAPHYSFGHLQTNDVVELVDKSSFRWRGRADGVINSGGVKMFPEELEVLYAPALKGRRYYVAAIPHPKWGQAPALVVEGPDTDIRAVLEAAVTDRKRLPSRIVFIAHLPETSNGKIRRLPLSCLQIQ